MVGIDPASDGLARPARLKVATSAEGIDGLLKLPTFKDIGIAQRDASSQLELSSLKETPGRSQVSLTPSGGLTRSGRSGGAQEAA